MILTYMEQQEGQLSPDASQLLGAASVLGEPAAVLVGEPGSCAEHAPALAAAGAQQIFCAEAPGASTQLVTPAVEALSRVMEETGATTVITSSTHEGREVAGRLALRCGAGVLTNVTAMETDGVATLSVLAGTYTTRAEITTQRRIYSVKPGGFPSAPPSERDTVTPIELHLDAPAGQIRERVHTSESTRPPLASAKVVVSGGRGVGSPEGFALVEQLADALRGAVGASRAAIDAGWYPHTFQVGQTGTSVSPKLYIACGISGAVQHVAGMNTAQVVVAINTDPSAPLFEIADLGVVGPVEEVVPQLIAAIQQR